MPVLLPTQAVFVEERYLASIFHARLRQVCATKATIAHVDVSQKFQAYVADNLKAQGDVDTVLKLLNDNGEGLGALKNTAVGYRLSNSARIFQKMSNLSADLLNINIATPVDMPARFNEVFVDAQLNLEDRPKPTGNTMLDMIRDLTHLRLVITGIKNFVEHALEANGQTIYSPQTKVKYDELKGELMELLNDAVRKIGQSAKIIERYATPAEMPIIEAIIENKPVLGKEVVFNLKGHAKSGVFYGDGLEWYDAPPYATSMVYPYTFKLKQMANCTLTANMRIWTSTRGVQNVIEVFVDDNKIATIKQEDSKNFLLETEIENLEPGHHKIRFEAHYECDGQTIDDGLNKAGNYWILRWLKVTAEYIQ